MPIYDTTIPGFAQMLRALRGILGKAEQAALAAGYDPLNLLHARLAPEMHDLATQVKYACTQAQECVHRLTHTALASLQTPAHMDGAKALIDQTLEVLSLADQAAINKSADSALSIELPQGLVFDMTGQEYAVNWAIPQFYFHLVTAYDILRHNGIALGKADYVAHMFAYVRQPA